jgi:uncharacterized protein (TIGR03905 family)
MKKVGLLVAGILIVGNAAFGAVKKDVIFTEEPHGACSTKMTVEVRDGKIYSFKAARGCPGNLNALSKLLPGMDVDYVIKMLEGNECTGAPMAGVTSCMDNLAQMLKYHVNGEGEGHVAEIRKKLMKAKGYTTTAFNNAGHVCTGCGLCEAVIG